MPNSTPLNRRHFLGVAAWLVGAGCAGPIATLTAPGATLGQEPSAPPYSGPMIDSHSHANHQHGYGEDELLKVMDNAGVGRVVVFGGQPRKTGRDRIIPVAYVTQPSSIGADLRLQLKDGWFRGLKAVVRHFPFPMQPAGVQGSAMSQQIRAAAALAAETRRPLTLHCDGPQTDDLATLCREYPEAPIIWAHAGGVPPRFGSGASSARVRQMLTDNPNLHIDLSARAPAFMGPVTYEEWGPVVEAFPTRILFGVDVFIRRFLAAVPDTVTYWRRWLGQLPPTVADQVAHQNAQRLFLT